MNVVDLIKYLLSKRKNILRYKNHKKGVLNYEKKYSNELNGKGKKK
jgi:hypothetical protein